MYIYTYISYLHICIIHTHTNTYMYVYVCVYMYIYVYTCTYKFHQFVVALENPAPEGRAGRALFHRTKERTHSSKSTRNGDTTKAREHILEREHIVVLSVYAPVSGGAEWGAVQKRECCSTFLKSQRPSLLKTKSHCIECF